MNFERKLALERIETLQGFLIVQRALAAMVIMQPKTEATDELITRIGELNQWLDKAIRNIEVMPDE